MNSKIQKIQKILKFKTFKIFYKQIQNSKLLKNFKKNFQNFLQKKFKIQNF